MWGVAPTLWRLVRSSLRHVAPLYAVRQGGSLAAAAAVPQSELAANHRSGWDAGHGPIRRPETGTVFIEAELWYGLEEATQRGRG